jgi:outer membrane protein assembly factor BamB
VRAVSPQREAAYKKWHELVAQADSPLHLRDSRTPLANAFREVERQSPLSVLAFDTATGKQLWGLSAAQSQGLKPLSLRACGGRAFCEKRGQLHCLDLRSGETLWTKSSDAMRALSEDALVCVSKRQVTLRSPADGEVRWKQPVSLATIRDVLLVGDSLWMGGGRPHDTGNSRHTGPAWGAYFAVQRDLKSGKILQEITAENPKHHHRCYENKATDRYILGGRRGTEFLDLESGEYLWHSWARGTCRYGVMPCNGMVYIPPHACGCYITVKLMGFNALAPADQQPRDTGNWDADARLARGPAFAESTAVTADSGSVDWPTFLGDTERSGRAAGNLPPVLTQRWQQELQGPITPATASGGQLYVARPEQHEVVALQAQDGQQVWAFTAGGRVDSPPTIHQGQVIFGCRDGYVYNLRARDGTLNWRYRAATQPRRVVADGQVESAAAIHGSVLIDEGMLVFTAGRSSYLDGGLELFRLDPQTGETLSKSTLYSPDPKTGQQPQQYGPNSMPGARSDILAADDQHLYLRDLTFDKLGNEIDQPQSHLFTLTDYLDDSCAHRSYWIFGTKPSISTGCSGRDRQLLYGRVLVFDDSTVYGYGRESVHWSNEFEDGRYRLFARHRDAQKPDWSVSTPVHIRAMLLAGDRILAAGSGTAPGKYTPVTSRKATPMLLVYSAVDGAEMARYALPSPPVQNGLAAADGCLYLALADGTLLCHGP